VMFFPGGMANDKIRTSSAEQLVLRIPATERNNRMYIIKRSQRFLEGFLKSYAPSNIKRLLWNKEFQVGKWNFIDDTPEDCVYSHLEQHARGGSILDLGCGPGNTANEVRENAYQNYVGVDISEEALAKAQKRTEKNGRGDKNRFVCTDFVTYVPTGQFDVILFRESMYHVPLGKVKTTLDRYSAYLKADGVFIVRMFIAKGDKASHRIVAMMRVMETEFCVLEKRQYGESGATIIVFRPRQR
jgi:SAM-dependent methyltransferase